MFVGGGGGLAVTTVFCKTDVESFVCVLGGGGGDSNTVTTECKTDMESVCGGVPALLQLCVGQTWNL